MNSRHKIMIIDDDKVSLHLLMETLEKYNVKAAETAEEALKLLPEFNPDLLLLDVNMPGMSGYELCRQIRTNDHYKLLKILFISGNISVDERLNGYDVGGDDYVSKPFDEDELRAKVEVFLKLKRREEIDETKSELLGLFNHETRTPLGAIIGLSDLLRIDAEKSIETRQCAQAIYENAKSLHKFIEKATLLSRLKSGYALQLIEDSVAAHIQNAIEPLQHIAKEKQLTFDIRGNKALKIVGDWDILKNVFSFILENAVKYSTRAGAIEISIEATNANCVVSITDRGRGISDSWITNIFDEFAIRDIQHHTRGQGLSLAIAKHIVELHQGRIHVENRLGSGGATFYIKLPILTPSTIPNGLWEGNPHETKESNTYN